MYAFLLILLVIIGNIQTEDVVIEPIRQNDCVPNAELTGICCDDGCETTCANPDKQCICVYFTLSCSCLPGYVLNKANNYTCVAINSLECRAQRYYSYVQLPPTCGPNSNFIYCGGCGATCTQPCICGRCVCLDGYLRDRYGNCIPANSFRCLIERPFITPQTVGPIE